MLKTIKVILIRFTLFPFLTRNNVLHYCFLNLAKRRFLKCLFFVSIWRQAWLRFDNGFNIFAWNFIMRWKDLFCLPTSSSPLTPHLVMSPLPHLVLVISSHSPPRHVPSLPTSSSTRHSPLPQFPSPGSPLLPLPCLSFSCPRKFATSSSQPDPLVHFSRLDLFLYLLGSILICIT